MKKKLLKNFRFYAIIDYDALKTKDAVKIAKELIIGGADIIQLRFKSACLAGRKTDSSKILKDAYRISRLSQKYKTLFLINDRADIARASGADGVHLGQDDLPVYAARRILGKDKIIGVSCHSLKQALRAQKHGADYVSIGPVFKTPTKPEYKSVGLSLVKEAKEKLKIPFVAIGGINLKNLQEVLNAGACRIAVVRAVCCAKNMQKTLINFKSQLTKQ